MFHTLAGIDLKESAPLRKPELGLIEPKPRLRFGGGLDAAKIVAFARPVYLLAGDFVELGALPAPPFHMSIGEGEIGGLPMTIGG